MPIKILHSNHVELVGTGYVLLTSPHKSSPVEIYPGNLVEDTALSSRAYAIIGKNNPTTNDEPVNAALGEITERINEIVKENGIKCILEIHSKQEPGIYIQTGEGKTCSEETATLILNQLSKNYRVTIDQQPQAPSGQSPTITGKKFVLQTVSVSIGSDDLALNRDKLVDQLAELVGMLNVRLGFDPARQPVPEG